MGLIYMIYNDVNDMIYIGQTSRSLDTRWYQHLRDSYRHHHVELFREEYKYIEKYNSKGQGYNSVRGTKRDHLPQQKRYKNIKEQEIENSINQNKQEEKVDLINIFYDNKVFDTVYDLAKYLYKNIKPYDEISPLNIISIVQNNTKGNVFLNPFRD